MKKIALAAFVAAAAMALFSEPSAQAQARRNGTIPLGTTDTGVRVGGVFFPTDTTLGVTVDAGATTNAGLTVYGTTTLNGNVSMPSTGNTTNCTLNGASPSTCTATVKASSKCICGPVGGSAAIAAGGCAGALSGTTFTAVSANALTNVVNIICL